MSTKETQYLLIERGKQYRVFRGGLVSITGQLSLINGIRLVTYFSKVVYLKYH